MKTLLMALLAFSLPGLQLLVAQNVPKSRRASTTYFTLSDSTVVVGQLVQQDASVVIVRKKNGELTYIEPSQIVRRTREKPGQPESPRDSVTSFSLKDGSAVYGRIVQKTPVAVVVRQANGTQTYIDPADILSTNTVAATASLPSLPITPANRPGGADRGVIPYLMSGRMAFTPRAGTVYYRNTYLIRNELETGITNGWSVGVAINPLINSLYRTSQLFSEAVYTNTNFGTQLYSRIAIPLGRKVRIGAGLTLQLQRPEFAPSNLNSLLGQVNATFGDQRSNITLGYTFRLDNNFPSRQEEGYLSIGAMQPLSPSLTFISDNSIKIRASDSGNLYSGPLARLTTALRIQRRHHAFDLGVLSAVSQAYAYGSGFGFNYARFKVYPYLGYTVQFGQRG